MSTGCRLRRGGYLLSHFRSTIGVVRFNFSVRNGKRWSPHAIATLVRFSHRPVSGLRPCKVEKRLWKRMSSDSYTVRVNLSGVTHDALMRLCQRLPRMSASAIDSFVPSGLQTYGDGIAPKKGFGRLVPLGSVRYRTCTCGLSTSSS